MRTHAPLRVEADDSITVATIRKGRNAELRICITTWNGRRTIDLRVWAMPATGGDYVPSRKGVALDIGKLDDIIAGLELARSHQ